MSYRSAARHEAQGFFPLGGENRNRFGPTADEPQPWAVQFLASALDDLAAETATGKALTFDAKWLLAWLVIGVDHAKPKETMRCSATGLAEWLRAPRPDEDQLDDQRARRMGGSLRRRLGAALEELDAAELIEWAPGRPGHDGFLKVSCYELLAAEGKPELGDFVPIYRTRIEEWSLKLGLDFDGRVLLLRALINTDPESLLVADSERELCDKLDIGHDRAARLLTLDGKLRRDPLPVRGQKLRAPRHDPRGILQRTNAGAIEMSVYWELVKPMGRHHRVSNARATRAFADVPHEAPRLKRASDQGFRGLDLGVDFADRVSNARAARLKRASDQDFYRGTCYLNSPTPPTPPRQQRLRL